MLHRASELQEFFETTYAREKEHDIWDLELKINAKELLARY
jgi:hypothetical protein